ncbi:MAG: LamG-like jellyroll fold domain-containing protein [Planctomycetota bacterium]
MHFHTFHCTTATLLLALAPVVQAQTPCASPDPRINVWWDAEPNGSGLAVDLVGNIDAVLAGGVGFGAMPGFGPDAFDFDGQSGHLESVQEMDVLDGDDWSFEGWIRPARLGVFQGLFSKLDPATERAGDVAVVLTPDGRVQVRYRTNASGGATERIFQTAPVFAAGSIHHVGVVIFNAASIGVTIDGQQASLTSTSVSFGVLPSGGFSRSTFVGCVLPGTLHFEGQMDELTFYSGGLVAPELALIAQAGTSLKCKLAAPLPAGAVAWYDGEVCREHALDRVGLESAPLTPRTGATVTTIPGMVGNGFDLGVGGGLNPQRPILRTTGPFTVEMWLFRRRSVTQEVLYTELNQPGQPAGELFFRILNQTLRLVRGTGVGSQAEGVSSRINIPLNTWTHVAGVFAGPGDLRLFVNGVRNDDPVALTSLTAQSNQDGGFGVGVIGINFLRAAIDECTLYRAALSQAEIDAIYRAGRFGKQSQTAPGLDCRNGTIEDLALDVTLSQGQVLAPPSLQQFASDTFFVRMTSPAGTFALDPYGILVQAYDAATPPIGSFPGLVVDLGSSGFIAGGLTPSVFGLPLLNPAGAQVALVVPASLAGFRVRMQGFALSPLAANGSFAATDPIDVQIRTASGGPGT